MKNNIRALMIIVVAQLCTLSQVSAFPKSQEWTPEKVVPTKECIRCHQDEADVWKSTEHFATYGNLHKGKRAKEIATEFGLSTTKIRKPDSVCAGCHYTVGTKNGAHRVVQGISCQSCHGAGADWLEAHNDYGSDTATKSSESAAHKAQRIKVIEDAGMVRPANYLGFAQNCYQCHLVANEELMNKTSHRGASDFSFLERTQGSILHTDPASADKQNKLIISGAIAEVVGALHALGSAKSAEGRYAQEMKQTASGAIQSVSSAVNATDDAQLRKIQAKLQGVNLRAGDQSLISLSKEVLRIGEGALGGQGSLHKTKVAKPVSRPKKVKSPASKPEPKPAAKASSTNTTAPANIPVVTQQVQPALVTESVSTVAPSPAVSSRISYFNVVSPPFEELCQASNPWSQGWVDSALLAQRPSCFGFVLSAPLNDSLFIFAKTGDRLLALHSSSCLALGANQSLNAKGYFELLPNINGRLGVVKLNGAANTVILVAMSQAAAVQAQASWAGVSDNCGKAGPYSYSELISLLESLSIQYAGQVDRQELGL